jgi:hypothetical protein
METFPRAGSRFGITMDNITESVLCAHLQFGTTTGIAAAIAVAKNGAGLNSGLNSMPSNRAGPDRRWRANFELMDVNETSP